MASKQELRSAITERLAHLSQKERAIESGVICKTLETLLKTLQPGTLGGYAPLASEPNIFPLLTALQLRGWKIALPSSTRDGMEFRLIHKLSELQHNRQWNIFEPAEGCPLCPAQDIDILIIPGRAFTLDGKRLGRGNGNYDMWLIHARKSNPDLKTIGVAFECQILDGIPEDTHDQRVDILISGRGMLERRNKG